MKEKGDEVTCLRSERGATPRNSCPWHFTGNFNLSVQAHIYRPVAPEKTEICNKYGVNLKRKRKPPRQKRSPMAPMKSDYISHYFTTLGFSATTSFTVLQRSQSKTNLSAVPNSLKQTLNMATGISVACYQNNEI